jgi:hypothetical protein
MAENSPVDTPSGDHPEMVVVVEITKIASQTLASSDG